MTTRRHLAARAKARDVDVGAAAPIDALPESIAFLFAAGAPLAHRLLVFLAGPYERAGDWVAKGKFADLHQKASKLVGRRSTSPLADRLAALGIHSEYRHRLLKEISGVAVGDDGSAWLRGNLGDRVELILQRANRPVTFDELVDLIPADYSHTYIRNRLVDDPRFKRVTRTRWALAEWPQQEYPGVANAIVAELQQRGGSLPLDRLARILGEKFAISRSSVVMMSGTSPLFVVEGAVVRLRSSDEEYKPKRRLEESHDCFFVDGAWAWRTSIDHDMRRGSGRQISEAFAFYLGVTPGTNKVFNTKRGAITVSWGKQYPAIGSMRRFIDGTDAVDGDLVFVRPLGNDQLDVSVTPRARTRTGSVRDRIAALCGTDSQGEGLAIAWDAVGLPRRGLITVTALRKRLARRRDDELLRLTDTL